MFSQRVEEFVSSKKLSELFGNSFPWDEIFKGTFNARRATGFLSGILASSAPILELHFDCGTLFLPRSKTPLPLQLVEDAGTGLALQVLLFFNVAFEF